MSHTLYSFTRFQKWTSARRRMQRAKTQDKRALIDLPTLKESLLGFLNNYVGFVKGKDILKTLLYSSRSFCKIQSNKKQTYRKGPLKSIWCVCEVYT